MNWDGQMRTAAVAAVPTHAPTLPTAAVAAAPKPAAPWETTHTVREAINTEEDMEHKTLVYSEMYDWITLLL